MSLCKLLPVPLLVAALVAGVASLSPGVALADDPSSNAAASSGEGEPPNSGESADPSGSETQTPVEVTIEGEWPDYSDVINYQVVGDFYFILMVDSVLLAVAVGALGWLTFRLR